MSPFPFRPAGCFAVLLLFCAMAVMGCGAGNGGYQYDKDCERLVGFRQEGQILVGYLDADGNFTRDRKYSPIPDTAYPANPALSSPDKSERSEESTQLYTGTYEVINKPRIANEPVYEYRAGSLIKGNLDNKGNFIPELESEVKPFTDYRYDWKALRIYNLPGKFVWKSQGGATSSQAGKP
jgi:hypothetical protein